MYPGDPDFTVDRYPDLCYGYVILAVIKGVANKQETLHEMERPIANLSAMYVNSKRDTKKTKEPYPMESFCLYRPPEKLNLPKYVYGSAARDAIEKGLYPHWALFCYKDLVSTADKQYRPAVTIAVCDDAVLIHPTKEDDGLRGLMIAQESAGGQIRLLTNDKGEQFEVIIPPVATKVVAVENSKLYFKS